MNDYYEFDALENRYFVNGEEVCDECFGRQVEEEYKRLDEVEGGPEEGDSDPGDCGHYATEGDTQQIAQQGYQLNEVEDYIVTATVNLLVRAVNRTDARIQVMDNLHTLIASGPYPNDPQNGCVITDIEQQEDLPEPPYTTH